MYNEQSEMDANTKQNPPFRNVAVARARTKIHFGNQLRQHYKIDRGIRNADRVWNMIPNGNDRGKLIRNARACFAITKFSRLQKSARRYNDVGL